MNASVLSAADLRARKAAREKIVMLTSYDASLTVHCERAGVDVLLVGDSLGMVIQGHDSTLPVTLEHMIYHCACVARARRRALLAVDMPYRSYETPAQAVANARRLLEAGGADMVKLEGGSAILPQLEALRDAGIRVCGHLGLLPQSVEELGGYKVQGRAPEDAERILNDALALERAGVEMIVLECIPSALGARISAALAIPTIGIGAGPDCDGQVLVSYDLLGLTPGRKPRFAHDFLAEQPAGKGIGEAIAAYVDAVRAGRFPGPEHGFD